MLSDTMPCLISLTILQEEHCYDYFHIQSYSGSRRLEFDPWLLTTKSMDGSTVPPHFDFQLKLSEMVCRNPADKNYITRRPKNEPPWAEWATQPWNTCRQKIFHQDFTPWMCQVAPKRKRSPGQQTILLSCALKPQIYFLDPGQHTFQTLPVLLSELRSYEQGWGNCRQTELAKILSHNTALHSSNIPQVHALGQHRSAERKINNDDKNSPWLDKTNIKWVRGQELPVNDLGFSVFFISRDCTILSISVRADSEVRH